MCASATYERAAVSWESRKQNRGRRNFLLPPGPLWGVPACQVSIAFLFAYLCIYVSLFTPRLQVCPALAPLSHRLFFYSFLLLPCPFPFFLRPPFGPFPTPVLIPPNAPFFAGLASRYQRRRTTRLSLRQRGSRRYPANHFCFHVLWSLWRRS